MAEALLRQRMMAICSRADRERLMIFLQYTVYHPLQYFLVFCRTGGIPDSYTIHQDTFDGGTVKGNRYLFIQASGNLGFIGPFSQQRRC